jgi:hypothetical protein
MERHHYFVMYDDAGWIVQADGENSEAFHSRFDALRGAIGLAELDHALGSRAQVIAQGEDGVFRAAWTSEFDAAPRPPASRRPKMNSAEANGSKSSTSKTDGSKTRRRSGDRREAA